MSEQNQDLHPDTQTQPRARRPFVEPKISSPVDVLEATTYFQVVDSGGIIGLLPGLRGGQDPNW